MNPKFRWFVVGWVIAAAGTAAAEDLADVLGAARVADVKTLAREIDPAVIEGRRLQAVLNERIERLGLFAVVDGRWVPIPFQIDERLAGGEYIFTGGKQSNAHLSTGRLKPTDELVFMAADTGARSDGSTAPTGGRSPVEVTVTDPLGGGTSWAYLFVFDGKVPRSKVDYVSYAAERERVTTDHYVIQYTPGEDHIYFSQLIVPEKAGGNGLEFCDRLKLRTHLKTRLFFSLDFDEEEWDSKVTQYLDGPVRVIRQVTNELRFLGISVAPKVRVDAVYYRDYHIAPAKIEQTLDLPTIAKEAWFQIVTDFNDNAKGMRYYRPTSSDESPWHAVDGRMEPDERSMKLATPRWHLLTGAPGTFLWWIDMPKPLEPVTRLTYVDDKDVEDPPEADPGQVGAVGFRFDLFPLKKGSYEMTLYYAFPSRWRPGDEELFFTAVNHPLRVEATSAERAGVDGERRPEGS